MGQVGFNQVFFMGIPVLKSSTVKGLVAKDGVIIAGSKEYEEILNHLKGQTTITDDRMAVALESLFKIVTKGEQ
jgi:hypothetical protein